MQATALKMQTYIGLFLLSAAALAICGAFYWHNMLYPACCDSLGYAIIAGSIQEHGLFHWQVHERTYGYPLFLSLILPQDTASLPQYGYFLSNVAATQSLLYVGACFALFFVLRRTNGKVAWCTAAGLLLSPFILNCVALQLTEGLIASLTVGLVTVVCALSLRTLTSAQACCLVFVGSLFAGYAMEVRPASIVLTLAWAVFLLVALRYLPPSRFAWIVCAALGLALPIGLQVALNYVLFDQPSPFPAQLGKEQLEWGLSLMKYGTYLEGDGTPTLLFPNSFFSAPDIKRWGAWLYVAQPLRGTATVLAHLFNSIDHGTFFTYAYDLRPWYRIPLNTLNHTMIFAAAFGIGRWLLERLPSWRCGSFASSDAIAIFLLIAVAGTCAINSVSAVETRFGLMIFGLAAPLAIYGILEWGALAARGRLVSGLGCLVYVMLALLASGQILDQAIPHGDMRALMRPARMETTSPSP